MTYKQALNIGVEAVGTVKCTYAMLYDKSGNKLFSFQRLDSMYTWEPNEELSARLGQTALVRRPDLSEADTSAYYYSAMNGTNTVNMPDVPVVRATQYVSGEKRVPVYLTDAAKQWIEACCPKGEVIEIYGKNGSLIRTLTEDKIYLLDGYINGGYTYDRVYRFENIHELLETGEPVYVKPDALFWTIEKLPENKELEELRAKYEQAKKILLASLPTALI